MAEKPRVLSQGTTLRLCQIDLGTVDLAVQEEGVQTKDNSRQGKDDGKGSCSTPTSSDSATTNVSGRLFQLGKDTVDVKASVGVGVEVVASGAQALLTFGGLFIRLLAKLNDLVVLVLVVVYVASDSSKITKQNNKVTELLETSKLSLGPMRDHTLTVVVIVVVVIVCILVNLQARDALRSDHGLSFVWQFLTVSQGFESTSLGQGCATSIHKETQVDGFTITAVAVGPSKVLLVTVDVVVVTIVVVVVIVAVVIVVTGIELC